MVGIVQPSTLKPEDEATQVKNLRGLVAPHIDSFNYAITDGLAILPRTIEPVYVDGPDPKENGVAENGDSPVEQDSKPPRISFRIKKVSIMRPRVKLDDGSRLESDMYPNYTRKARRNYDGALNVDIETLVNGEVVTEHQRTTTMRAGKVPIMLGSKLCHIAKKSPRELVAMREEEYELGGYFIANGLEKLVRMVIVPRRNHMIAVKRDNNATKGKLYSNYAIAMRCVRPDQSAVNCKLHYLTTGTITLRVLVNRGEYFIPVGAVIRALLPPGFSDREMFDMIIGGHYDQQDLRTTALAIVSEAKQFSKKFSAKYAEGGCPLRLSQTAALGFFGDMFKVSMNISDDTSSIEAGRMLLRRHVLVHLSTLWDEASDPSLDAGKVDVLVLMIRKLVGVVNSRVEEDNSDALSHQEVLLPGHLYLIYLKNCLENLLRSVAAGVRKEYEMAKKQGSHKETPPGPSAIAAKALSKEFQARSVELRMGYFIATGNLKNSGDIDLPQHTGYTIIAERINYFRFLSHFRCLHRGAAFAKLRTTTVRKLLPEAWGFVCPVHTPDGTPCGLLNHITTSATVSMGQSTDSMSLINLLLELGALPPPSLSKIHLASAANHLPVLADGRVIAFVNASSAPTVAEQLRLLKTRENVEQLSKTTEVVYIPPTNGGFYPGIYIQTTPGRLLRPVHWLKRRPADTTTHIPELIGTLEQVFLQVRPRYNEPKDSHRYIDLESATHAEVSPMHILSNMASMTPFSDMNQSPRNVYQCQMGKQAMGTPCHMFDSRYESKAYRLMATQAPITRNEESHQRIGIDLFPNGFNAVVAVLSYTGYDMEDAMVINKQSLDRGFARGTVYTNTLVDLDGSSHNISRQFAELSDQEAKATSALDIDGFPGIGARVSAGDAVYATASRGESSEAKKAIRKVAIEAYKSVEPASVDEVILLPKATKQKGANAGLPDNTVRRASVRLRISRTPVIGDKFASRAGQKGTLANIWPTEDMPFSESGIVPDLLFNPNGFPSRMTIGMMIECMAGKSGALHGQFKDSTPFRFDEKVLAVDHFGKELRKAGYNYYGNETLYSGYTGEPFKVEIFTGIVYYQRLRHMVSDKFQLRSTGKVHPVFRQPIKGRKRGGAIRFGEMERDALISHGASFLLKDRLANCSDQHILHICQTCGSLISPLASRVSRGTGDERDQGLWDLKCKCCKDDGVIRKVAIPYVFKYLTYELAAMNIRTVFDVK